MISRLFCLAALAAAPAFAQVSWYAGLAGGQARTDIEAVRNRESTITLVSSLQTDFDDRDAAWKVFAGMRFLPGLGLEVTYADLGRATTTTRGLGGNPALPFAIAINRDVTAVGIDLVGHAQLPARLTLQGKVGYYRTTLKADATLEGNIVFNNSSDERFRSTKLNEETTHLGVGLEWAMTRRWAIRAEYEKFLNVGKPFQAGGTGTTGEADLDAAWVGVVARF